MHGGLSPSIDTLDTVRTLDRVQEVRHCRDAGWIKARGLFAQVFVLFVCGALRWTYTSFYFHSLMRPHGLDMPRSLRHPAKGTCGT